MTLAFETSEPRPSMREIALGVAARYDVTLADLRGHNRHRRFAHPRHEAMYLTYETGRFSNLKIAIYYGDRDHTTVVNARHAHAARLQAAGEAVAA